MELASFMVIQVYHIDLVLGGPATLTCSLEIWENKSS